MLVLVLEKGNAESAVLLAFALARGVLTAFSSIAFARSWDIAMRMPTVPSPSP